MLQDHRIVAVIPCGRERYLRALLPYLLSDRCGCVDEVHMWVNTDVQSDLEFFAAMEAKHPKLKRVFTGGQLRKGLYDASRNHYQYNDSVNRFYPLCVDHKTVYVKLDDDICYVHPGFFEAICGEAIAREGKAFGVLGNVWNVPLTSKLHQERGIIDHRFGACTGDPRCPVACTNGEFAAYLHERFFELLAANELDRLRFPSFDITGRNRIGAMAWLGETFARFGGHVGDADEKELTQRLPQSLDLPLRMCGDAIVSHFCFSHQRAFCEDHTDTLQRYQQLAVQQTGVTL